MTERFRDGDRAVSYLSSGLQADFPDAFVDVLYLSREHSRRARCPVQDAATVLRSFCREFPKASVDYYPENPYGVVGEIRCHGHFKGDGEHDEGAHDLGHHNDSAHPHKERPTVVIVVSKPKTAVKPEEHARPHAARRVV